MDFEIEMSSGLVTAIHVLVVDLLLTWLIVTGVDDFLAAHQRHKWFDKGKENSSLIQILKAGPFGDYAGTRWDNRIRVGTAIAALILAVGTSLGLEGFTKQTWRTEEIVRIVLDQENVLNYTFDDLVIDQDTHPRRSQKNVLLSQYLSCWTSTEKEDVWTPAITGEGGEFIRCLDIEEAEVNGVLKLWPRSGGTGTKRTCSYPGVWGIVPTDFTNYIKPEDIIIDATIGVHPDDLNATETAKMPKNTNCIWEGITFEELTCSKSWCVGFGKNANGSDIIFKSQDALLRNSTSDSTRTQELTSAVVPDLNMETLDSKRLLMFYLAGYDIRRSLQIVSMMAGEKVRMKTKTGRTTAATSVSSWYIPVVGGFFSLALALRLIRVILYRNSIDLRGKHDRLDVSGIWSLYVNAEKGGTKSSMKCDYKNIKIGWKAADQHFGIVEEVSLH